MNEKAQYIYGFILAEEEQRSSLVGIEGADVSTVRCRDIAALVSPISLSSFDDLPKGTLLRYLTVYQSVLEATLKKQIVIPVKFGAILMGERSVRTALEKGYDHISASLGKMKTQIEIDIAALWEDVTAVLAEIGETEEIKVLKRSALVMPEDQQFELRVKAGKQVKTLLDQRKELIKREIMDALLPYAESHRVHGLMDDAMIVNVALLIERDQAMPIEETVSELDQRFGNQINFRLIGPLPPYSFETLEIKSMDYDLLNEARNTLELDDQTTVQEMREAYWNLTKKYHPDRSPGDAYVQRQFEKINYAYKIVNDYCRENGCSFRKQDVTSWLRVQPVKA